MRLRFHYFLAGLLIFGTVCHAQGNNAGQEAKVQQLLSRMSLDQKLKLVGGTDSMFTFAFPEIGLQAIKMSDGPSGVRTWGTSNAYPVGIAVAATWDPAAASRLGVALGEDAKARGVRVLLAPGVDIYRAPMGGRNFEYMGEDPFLASRMVVGYITGVQSQGVSATVKHFVANDSEYDRHNTNAIIDERTLREIYLPPFEAAVKDAHVSAVMDSYNLLNGQHLTQNGLMNNEILKKEWGFDGLLMSDWNATYDGVAAANGGLDLEMPKAKFMTPAVLGAAIKNGSLSVATLDDHVRRILRLAVRYGLAGDTKVEPSGSLYNLAGKRVAYDVAAESIVLLKNENNILPLDRTKVHRVAVIGPNAYPAVFGGGGSSAVTPFAASDLYTSLTEAMGPGVEVDYSPGIMKEQDVFAKTDFEHGLTQEVFSNANFTGEAQKSKKQRLNEWSASPAFGGDAQAKSYRWTGTYNAKTGGDYIFLIGGHRGDSYTLRVDKKVVFEHVKSEGSGPASFVMHLDAGRSTEVQLDFVQRTRDLIAGLGIVPVSDIVLPEAKEMAAKADAVVVSVGYNPSYESEGFDRPWKLLAGQDELVQAVVAANPKTVVVLNAGGGADVSKWIDRVPAFVHAWYGGEEGGHALADVLDGTVNPSGKLPISYERRLEDDATFNTYYPKPGTKDVVYTEGIFIGYRHFDRSETKPLFPFGFGLSYTHFAFSNLRVKEDGPGMVDVSFDVRNTGSRPGDEIAEVYVGEKGSSVQRPVKELKGFQRLHLTPGESHRVDLKLDSRAFSYWDTASHGWKRDAAEFQIYVGDSSASVPLMKTISLK